MVSEKSSRVAKFPKYASAFVRQPYRRGMAIVGTSGLVFAIGITGVNPAIAASPFPCVNDNSANDNTAEPGINPTASRNAILEVLDDHVEICLQGAFTISEPISFQADIHVYGVGGLEKSSIEPVSGGVFVSSPGPDSDIGYNITVENLEIKNADEYAVVGRDVFVIDSIFKDNLAGAVLAQSQAIVEKSTFTGNRGEGAITIADVTLSEISAITDSTFTDNQRDDPDGADELQAAGGAIFGYAILITNSTFVENSVSGANSAGGAVAAYAVIVSNSTFVDNVAEGAGAEGGAVYAEGGEIAFSTFLNNEAAPPELDGDTPGNAIYKGNGNFLAPDFLVAANIFAGTSQNPQLGFGDLAEPFIDVGGNVFSTTSEVETDIDQNEGSVFEATISSLFGTSSPELATLEPNSNGTQTIALSPTGPAIDSVPLETYESVITFVEGFNSAYGAEEEFQLSAAIDQRGMPRSHPADSGAYEYVEPAANQTQPDSLAKTGSDIPAVFTAAWLGFVTLGAIAVSWSIKLRRRTAK